jgi:superfamily I DNA and RNA helicase
LKNLFRKGENAVSLIEDPVRPYKGGIDKDVILTKAYRCPIEVLMLAHGVGLGIHAPTCVQMIESRASWEALGYHVVAGKFEPMHPVSIERPAENSPNLISEVYDGTLPTVCHHCADTREAEIEWVTNEIATLLDREEVRPEDIIVITMNSFEQAEQLRLLDRNLGARGIENIRPGMTSHAGLFAEDGKVTLAGVRRAKGNEAFVVFIMGYDALYSYTISLEARNKAFTAISRAKGWVRISGTGPLMRQAAQEIDRILQDVPFFKFTFRKGIQRTLEAESGRRMSRFKRAQSSLEELLAAEPELLNTLKVRRPDKVKELTSRLRELENEVGGS